MARDRDADGRLARLRRRVNSGSRRLPASFAPNAWAERIDQRRAAGRELLDLTVTNPTRVGLSAAGPEILRALTDPRAAEDRPDPRGRLEARAAVAAYYESRGTPIDLDHVVLTTGTSESYAHLFRLIAEPGDAVLIPTPSYPLIEPIARLEGIETIPYRLAYDGAWHLDLGSLDQALDQAGDRGRAAIVIEPHHPTGICLTLAEREALESRLESRGMALISDEVFGDYAWPPYVPFEGWLGARRVPTFVLSGLSKVCGLPQLKLGWIVAAGPDEARRRGLQGLEWIADLFLTVGAPVQLALPSLLASRASFQARLRDRLVAHRDALAAFARDCPEASVLEGEGGWAAVVRLPAGGEDVSLRLLEHDVIVHPGHFFDLEMEGCVVLSLIAEPATFRRGLERIVEALAMQ